MTPLRVEASALEAAREFFEQQGSVGCEGTAMLAGRPGEITRCVVPDQVATRTRLGVSVEITGKGKLELASALPDEERYLSRIHSHPSEAFHSATDHDNPGLTASGAYSIVVPFFGLGLRRGLSACAVYIFDSGAWIEVPSDELDQHLVVA